MKRARKTLSIGVALVVLWCIYGFFISEMFSSIENSLNSYLSTQILPTLEAEIVKHTSRYKDDGFRLKRYHALQETLSCFLEEGSWVDFDKGQRVQPRSRNRYEGAGSLCSETEFLRNVSLSEPRINTLCPLLPSKKILFVGPETTFHLHSNLLRALELHENRSHSCLGAEFCTFHQICRTPRLPDSPEPFFPPGGYKKYPNNRELIASQSGVLKYILSNSLYTGLDTQDTKYTDPVAQVDRDSGVRQKERYWMGQARKADLLVLNRGPLPAPAWTYDGSRRGNWPAAFLEGKPSEVTGNRRKRRNGQNGVKVFGERILDAALHVTLDRFLPETVETLKTLAMGTRGKKQSIVWHSSWYMEPTCTEDDGGRKTVLDSELNPWTLWYNGQGAKI